jgi:ABC-type dipeptide/oligopeptide/nickel transport system, ATPase component
MNEDILLTVEDLEVEFATAHGPVPALRGVSFAMNAARCWASWAKAARARRSPAAR